MEIFNVILIIGVVQGLVFNTINFYNFKLKNKIVVYLNLFVLFLTLNNLQAWLVEKDISFPFYYLKNLLVPWYILITPMFFLFLSKYLGKEKRAKFVLFTTIIIFCLSISTRLSFLYLINDTQNDNSFLASIKLYNTVEEILGFIFTLALFVYCIILFIKTFRSFHTILEYDNLKWLKTFFILGFIVILFWLIAIVLNSAYNFNDSSVFYSPLRISTSLLIYWLGYQGMYQQKFISDRILIRKSLLQQVTTIDDKPVNKIYADKQKELFYKIHTYIIENKKYNNPLLSLELLAVEFNLSTSQLSPIINKYANKNFTDYINEFRVEQAKVLLINSSYKNYTVLSIGLESGFNSKSTFYCVFKKHTGVTPAKFRKIELKK